MSEGYREDLAFIHDDGFGFFAENAAPVLLEDLRRRGHVSGVVIDLGCGSGILSAPVAAAGYDVLGIDLAPAMLALARQRVPGGTFRAGSVFTAELPRCVGVAAIGEIVNFLFDETKPGTRLRPLFRRIHAALRPGGCFILDVAGPGRVPADRRRTFVEREDWAVLVDANEDRERRLLTRTITSFRKVGETYRRDREVHRLRLMAPAEVAGVLREVGFRVQRLRSYGPQRFGPGHAGFLARKP